MTRKGTFIQTDRCLESETRLMRPSWSSSRTEGPLRSVRCSRPRGHDGDCEWRHVPFGRFTPEAIEAARIRPLGTQQRGRGIHGGSLA